VKLTTAAIVSDIQASTYSKYTNTQRPKFGMSIPKPACPNMAAATPLGPPGAQTSHKQHAGLLELDAQPSRQNPSSRGRGTEGL
jgi:hypothetical protein